MKTRQELIDFHRNYCVHYDTRNGGPTSCLQGMKIDRVQAPGGRMKWSPCIEGHLLKDACAICPKWERRSQESAEAYADSWMRVMGNMLKVDPVIEEWRKKKPIGKQETIECPICKGRLHLSQSEYNGHVRAKCETDGCVAFIE